MKSPIVANPPTDHANICGLGRRRPRTIAVCDFLIALRRAAVWDYLMATIQLSNAIENQ
jgi:hypothetical protein